MLRRALAVAFCLTLPIALVAGEGTKLREIDVKNLKLAIKKGQAEKPTIITTTTELDNAIPGADAIKKQVDFTKEKLALFVWAGSGGDKLAGKLSDDAKTANFSYTRGLTRDLRSHVHLYAMPKNAELKFGK
jgi:hypothetical protein